MNRLSEMIMRHGPPIGDVVEHYKREAEHWRQRYEALHEALIKNAFMHTHPAVTLMAEPEIYEAGRIKGREEGAAAEREACAREAETLWQQHQDTKDAHERLSPEPFMPGRFGFDQSTVQQSRRIANAIRARGQA